MRVKAAHLPSPPTKYKHPENWCDRGSQGLASIISYLEEMRLMTETRRVLQTQPQALGTLRSALLHSAKLPSLESSLPGLSVPRPLLMNPNLRGGGQGHKQPLWDLSGGGRKQRGPKTTLSPPRRGCSYLLTPSLITSKEDGRTQGSLSDPSQKHPSLLYFMTPPHPTLQNTQGPQLSLAVSGSPRPGGRELRWTEQLELG